MESCNQLLAKHFGTLTAFVVLGILVVAIGMILSQKMKLPKPLLVFLACCMLVFAVPAVHIVRGFQDFHHQDYVVYYGGFTVSERHELSGNLTLRDENRMSIRMQGDFPLSNGEYTGYVVYAKRTRLLLAYDPYENPLGGHGLHPTAAGVRSPRQ